MRREENIKIFQDTERLCKTNSRLKAAIRHSVSSQKLILESDTILGFDKKKYDEPAKVFVSKKRSYEAASAYKGKNVCVHNFASASNPGGGVTRGANAQRNACVDVQFYISV